MTPYNSPFLAKSASEWGALQLAASGSWQRCPHVWDTRELDALALSYASGRPLLIRGEPGTGKSQVARAAAALLDWDFRYEVINARHEAQDLLWQYDAVERLAVAHRGDNTAMRDFVTPRLLWWALNPTSARLQEQHAQAKTQAKGQASTGNAKPTTKAHKGTVILLDEIDKADSDLPNSLLEVLANGGFTLPWGEALHAPGSPPAPTLIVLTSNEERELPSAFVRRCICLHLVPPKDTERDQFIAWLKARAEAHFPGMADSVLLAAAEMVHADRKDCTMGMGTRPGLAEYLDLLRAVKEIAPINYAQQTALLEKIAPYALIKQYPADQQRGVRHGESQ